MNNYYVYRHIRKDTDTPFYVGKGKGDRAYWKYRRNSYWKNIVHKCGYEVEIIMENLTEEQAFAKEVEFIKLYKSLGYCEANMTNGGEGFSGYSPWNKGKKGIRLSKKTEFKKGHIPWNRGVDPLTNTQRENWKKHMKDYVFTDSVKEKISISHGAKPFLVYKNGKLIGEWINASQCKRDLHLTSVSNIISCLKGIRKHHKHYYFKYK